jgi:hypothetical protein
MSKLGSLIAIPVGFALVRAIVDKIPEDTTPIVPIIPTLPPEPGPPRPIIPLPESGLEKLRIEVDPNIVPFFPDTAVTAAEEFIAKDPFSGLAGLKDLIPQTGLPTEFNIDWTKRPTD